MVYNKVYDVLLEGNEYDHQQALDWARGFVFMECETSEQEIAHATGVGIVGGIGVYYCFGADHYFFTDETGSDDDCT